jgi:hypothetical protein
LSELFDGIARSFLRREFAHLSLGQRSHGGVFHEPLIIYFGLCGSVIGHRAWTRGWIIAWKVGGRLTAHGHMATRRLRQSRTTWLDDYPSTRDNQAQP